MRRRRVGHRGRIGRRQARRHDSASCTLSCMSRRPRILLASALALRCRWGRLPDDLSFTHLVGASFVAGIGFTVSLFVADLSFTGAMLDAAKIAVLAASIISAVVGALWLLTMPARNQRRASHLTF